jgi:hypothetical protein
MLPGGKFSEPIEERPANITRSGLRLSVKVGDLVKMDFEDVDTWPVGDVWGIGIIVDDDFDVGRDDVQVLWSEMGLGWEMGSMLEVINESR